MIGYKLVRDEHGHLISAFQWNYRVHYKVNKWAKPHKNCGALAVFTTEAAAREYRQERFEGLLIFRCEYTPSQDPHLYTPFATKRDPPEGTAFASRVKLVEWIE